MEILLKDAIGMLKTIGEFKMPLKDQDPEVNMIDGQSCNYMLKANMYL